MWRRRLAILCGGAHNNVWMIETFRGSRGCAPECAEHTCAFALDWPRGPRILLRLTGFGGFQAEESDSLVTHNFFGVLSCRSQPIKAGGQAFGPCRAPGTRFCCFFAQGCVPPFLRLDLIFREPSLAERVTSTNVGIEGHHYSCGPQVTA